MQKGKRKTVESKAGTSGRQKASRVVTKMGPPDPKDAMEYEKNGNEKEIWLPGVDGMEEGEELDFDPSAYTTYHSFKMEWPCLSFDVLRDPQGFHRTKFPHQMYLACGSQAATAEENKVYLMKISNIQKTYKRGEDGMSEDEDEEDSDEEVLPDIKEKSFAHPGGVNRLRAMPQAANIIATMSDTKKVHIWDTQHLLGSLDAPPTSIPKTEPIETFAGHPQEGFALDWSPVVPGRLLTGDCSKHIYLWDRTSSGWSVDKVPFGGHSGSVEDVQWSPAEKNVFASCSVDKTVRIYDTRKKKDSMLFVAAHKQDVNVISWNPKKSHLLLSGSDDNTFKVWDLRKFKSNSPLGHFTYHRAPITSIEWHPTEDAMLAVASADNTLTVWDLALEADTDTKSNSKVDEIPPQLLFVHQGQKNVKELHFHPQIPGMVVSTAESGLNLFKPCNL